jgi:hypothetical protein
MKKLTPLKIPKIKDRDLFRLSIIPRKKGAHTDLKKEDSKKKCRKKPPTEEKE